MEKKNIKNYIKPAYIKEELRTADIILSSVLNGTTLEKGDQEDTGIVSVAMSYILGY